MTTEEIGAFGFMLFGLSFYLLVVLVIIRDNRESYDRRIAEQREFGSVEPRATEPPEVTHTRRFRRKR